MKIILNQDIQNLGEEGDILEVKNGYARNYLLPKNIAVLFNKTNQALFAGRAAAIEKRKQEKRKAASSVRDQLNDLTLNLVVSAGESGKLFGSVTSTMVQEALAKHDLTIEKKRIEVASHEIKNVGNYSVKIRLYEGESAIVKLIVKSEEDVKKEAAEKVAAEAKAAKEAEKAAKAAAEVAKTEPEV
ncbi:MAG: 50S ribosomal protein L9 [Spirochaetia bacterium]|nr:50S ribosomal protein L9 [Spirochaetia bacterium]